MDGDQCIWGNIFVLEREERKREKEKEIEEKCSQSGITACLQLCVQGRQDSTVHL